LLSSACRRRHLSPRVRKPGKRETGNGTRRPLPVSAADEAGIGAALAQARLAAASDEVPVGAVVVRRENPIARGHNETVARGDPTAHAELLAIQQALKTLGADRLDDCTLYVTLEPCAQCAGAIVLAKVARLVFGAYDPKAGMAGSVGDLLRHPKLNHRVEVIGGVEAEACGELLRDYFRAKRAE